MDFSKLFHEFVRRREVLVLWAGAGEEDRGDFSERLPLLQLTGQMPPAQEGRFDENDEVGSYWKEILGRFIAYILCCS